MSAVNQIISPRVRAATTAALSSWPCPPPPPPIGERAEADGECAESDADPSDSLDCDRRDAVSEVIFASRLAPGSERKLSMLSSPSSRNAWFSSSAVLWRSSGSRLKQHAADR